MQMKDFGVKRNASGYYDETCYKGITAGPSPGEIWLHSKSGAYCLIVSDNGGICNCLKMYENYQEGEISVLARVPMYVNPLKITYARTTDLTQYVKSIPEAEFKAIHRAVLRALKGGTQD